jgi:flagellar protein FliS
MFGSMKSGANAYARVGVETGVMAASPHKLIVMLFEGAMVAVSAAAQQMAAGDIAGKGKSVSRAISIIEEGLRASLDRKAGGEIAANLDSLYQYMTVRLVIANRDNQAAILEEVLRLLGELKGAWDQIAPAGPALQPVETDSPDAHATGAVLMRA